MQVRDAFISTGPLMPKWVQRSAPARRTRMAPSAQIASSTSWDTPDNWAWIYGSDKTSGASAGVVGTIVWPSRFAIS